MIFCLVLFSTFKIFIWHDQLLSVVGPTTFLRFNDLWQRTLDMSLSQHSLSFGLLLLHRYLRIDRVTLDELAFVKLLLHLPRFYLQSDFSLLLDKLAILHRLTISL